MPYKRNKVSKVLQAGRTGSEKRGMYFARRGADRRHQGVWLTILRWSWSCGKYCQLTQDGCWDDQQKDSQRQQALGKGEIHLSCLFDQQV